MSGKEVVLILFVFGVVLVGALCFGLYYGLLYWFWEVLCVLGIWEVEILGGLRNEVKV